jgi:16S rRNA (cytidine1402-2'-O)-methyltransferase
MSDTRDRREPRATPTRARGTLYLVPNLLGTVPAGDVLPERTIAVARRLVHWIVETPKPARAFLRTLVGRPVGELDIGPLGDAPTPADLDRMLAPVLRGEDVGLLSDAGCPAVADPGALLVAAAHAASIAVVPLVGPSSLLLALMASGMNGQRFTFHGYLPAAAAERGPALKRLEAASRAHRSAELFIETPYRNVAMLQTIVATLAPATRLCVAADLTLPGESVTTLPVSRWRNVDAARYAKRPAIFIVQASEGR